MSEADGVDGGAFCKRGFIHLQFAEKLESPKAERHLGSVESPLVRGSPAAATSKRWDPGRHDRSCLEMSEADGVDGGAICKRGFIHLQFAEKLEAPEAEKHHVSRGRISFLPFGQARRKFAYVDWHRRWCSRARLSPKLDPTYSTYSRECFRNTRVSICEGGRIQFWVPAFVAKHSRLCSNEVVKSRATVSPWVSRSSNLHAVGPGSEVLVICRNLIGCKYHLANGCVL
ncbi:hypothetical protein V1477_010513 [Vespula maculifrons]|uniref:Uncharacterized protein n=1 Tax=Vespula maculifrons TaxID=7453 RepID=A0ABD2C6R1_VESMC